jgi:hypothetical protein
MHLLISVRGTVILFFLFVLLRVLLRRPWLAAGAFVLILSATKFLGSSHPGVEVPFQFLIYCSAAFVVVRYGLVALASGIFVADLLLNLPVSNGLSSWYMGSTLFVTASVIVLAAWGFHTSLGGRPVWSVDRFD